MQALGWQLPAFDARAEVAPGDHRIVVAAAGIRRIGGMQVPELVSQAIPDLDKDGPRKYARQEPLILLHRQSFECLGAHVRFLSAPHRR